jgi:hypothetical protein
MEEHEETETAESVAISRLGGDNSMLAFPGKACQHSVPSAPAGCGKKGITLPRPILPLVSLSRLGKRSFGGLGRERLLAMAGVLRNRSNPRLSEAYQRLTESKSNILHKSNVRGQLPQATICQDWRRTSSLTTEALWSRTTTIFLRPKTFVRRFHHLYFQKTFVRRFLHLKNNLFAVCNISTDRNSNLFFSFKTDKINDICQLTSLNNCIQFPSDNRKTILSYSWCHFGNFIPKTEVSSGNWKISDVSSRIS